MLFLPPLAASRIGRVLAVQKVCQSDSRARDPPVMRRLMPDRALPVKFQPARGSPVIPIGQRREDVQVPWIWHSGLVRLRMFGPAEKQDRSGSAMFGRAVRPGRDTRFLRRKTGGQSAGRPNLVSSSPCRVTLMARHRNPAENRCGPCGSAPCNCKGFHCVPQQRQSRPLSLFWESARPQPNSSRRSCGPVAFLPAMQPQARAISMKDACQRYGARTSGSPAGTVGPTRRRRLDVRQEHTAR